MAIVAHWEATEASTRRPREPRRKLLLEARGALPSGASAEILVHDISTTGLLLESAVPLGIDEKIGIELPHAGTTWATVIWTSGKLFGCQFETPISTGALSAAQLRSAVGQPVNVAPRSTALPDATFGARLQRLRKERGISQAQVATSLGVSKPTVWAWEHGKARPIDSRIADLASVLGVERADLLAQPANAEARDFITRSRVEIAAAFGTTPEKIRIWIEL